MPGKVPARHAQSARSALRIAITTAGLLLLAACATHGVRLGKIAQDYQQASGAPGVAIGIVLGDGRTLHKGIGVVRLPSGQPVTPATLFHMASITKPFVATAVLQLAERGKVELDAPLTRYLPYFRVADTRFREITIRQMLNHTSGLPDVTDYGWDRPEFDDAALERYVRSLGNVKLVSAPGAAFKYSDMAYDILGDVIAKASGRPFETYIAEEVLRPAGMTRSTLLLRAAPAKLMASPHMEAVDGRPEVSATFPYNRPHAGSSTLYSNIDEMLLWAKIVLAHGNAGETRILSEQSFAMQTRPGEVVPNDPELAKYHPAMGLGWFLLTIGGERVIWHRGQDVGFTTNMFVAPDRGVAVVAMSNIATGQSTTQIFDMCAKALLEAINANGERK